MLDKRKASRMTKIVALLIAFTFVLSLIPYLSGFTRSSSNSNMNMGTRSAKRSDLVPLKQNASGALQSLMGQGDLSYENKDYPQAISYYEEALKLDPKNVDLLAKVGSSYFLKEEKTKAEEKLRAALDINPNHPHANFYLGELLRSLNQKEQAISAYENYLRIEPQGAHAQDAKNALKELQEP